MGAILRAAAIYLVLLLVFRIAGKRTVAQMTTFDFLLLLIISEATQQAMLGGDFSIINAALVIVTLVGLDIGLSLWKQKWPKLDKLLEGMPLVLVEDGQLLKDRMDKVRVDESDILTAARDSHGLERMEQIKYAVLERSGGISIIPKKD